MAKNMLIDSAHMEEIRVAIVDGERLERFDFETPLKARIRGNIYLAKVIRVEPSLQAAFIDYGCDKHGFLSFSEIHHDYFQIPVGDRQELESHIQNAITARIAETGEAEEELDPKEASKLRYQFYRRYKIQEVIKKKQIMLVQVTKEERGNKGAALTTYISLAGKYCVLMPNTSKSSGVSRKIINHVDRSKLKKIVSELHIENGSTVIRTAGIGHTKIEIKKDFDYLVNLWDEIRETTIKSTAPCLINEEASIIKRAIRDSYSRDIDMIFVEGEEGFKIAKSFLKKLMPNHIKKIKLYDDKKMPLFSKFKVNEQINQIYSTRVELPSGGYLIINTTEALISIDVNSGKATRERNISGTALKTNLEAATEIARQCRLRDLAGLIVVDFIDMEEKRDNVQVERCLRDALREDKAKIQMGTISNFGLLELSRQRLRSSIVDANMTVCTHCNGSGFMWSDESIAIQALRKIEGACSTLDSSEVLVTLSTNVALYIMNNKRSFISHIEGRGNFKITFNIDPEIAGSDFKIEQISKPVVVEYDEVHNTSNKKHKVQIDNKQSNIIEKLSPESSNEASATVGEASPKTDVLTTKRSRNNRDRYRDKRKKYENKPEEDDSEKIKEVFILAAKKEYDQIDQKDHIQKKKKSEDGDNKTNEKKTVENHVTQTELQAISKEKVSDVTENALNPISDQETKIKNKKRSGWWQKLLKNPEN